MADSTGEPFGLPEGTVRGIIALAFMALLAFNFVTKNTIDPILLATSGPYFGFYFASRQATTAAKASVAAIVASDTVDPPAYGGDTDEAGIVANKGGKVA
jgi:hypothetical protein